MSNSTAQVLVGGLKRGSAFVLSGPAGAGKTTLVAQLMGEFSCVKESISWTTRSPRSTEKDGEHYHFVTQEAFDAKEAEGGFLEHVRLFDSSYGTCRDHVDAELEQGNHVVMVIDIQGALQLKDCYPAKLIFVQPPSEEVLKERLQHRRTESEASLEKRLKRATEEMQLADEYDYVIINNDFDTAYQVLRSIVIAEAHAAKELEINPLK